jgi:Flp pilus assembly pilin Flp
MWTRAVQYGRGRVWRLIADERGQDLIEYALLTGMITIASVLAFSSLKVRMQDAYQAWVGNAAAISTPPPPSGS